jgi:hypothetical protein
MTFPEAMADENQSASATITMADRVNTPEVIEKVQLVDRSKNRSKH